MISLFVSFFISRFIYLCIVSSSRSLQSTFPVGMQSDNRLRTIGLSFLPTLRTLLEPWLNGRKYVLGPIGSVVSEIMMATRNFVGTTNEKWGYGYRIIIILHFYCIRNSKTYKIIFIINLL